jgi:hypothetical protein
MPLADLTVLRDTIRRHGVPLALYRDRHGIFETPKGQPLTLEEQLVDRRRPTQFGRALAEFGITSIAAQSPQAKGRIERAWGTCQDRLVVELRLAGASDLASANRVLAQFVSRFNRQFGVPAANPEPAWRALPAELSLEAVCCLKYRRVVAHDNTVRAGATILQLQLARARAAMPVDGSSCSSGSTAVSSSGTGSGESSSSRRPPTPSSCGPSITPEPSSDRSLRASARPPFPRPPIPGVRSNLDPSSTSASSRSDCQDHGSGDLTESLICDIKRRYDRGAAGWP